MANIVLVKRNEVEEWQERYKRLKYDLALKRKKVTLKLDNCKKRFQRQYEEIERQRENDITDLKERYEAL